MRLVGHAVGMYEKKWMQKFGQKTRMEDVTSELQVLEDNIKMYHREVESEGVDCNRLAEDSLVVGSCEYGHELSGYKKAAQDHRYS
jgi:hypothetical protein